MKYFIYIALVMLCATRALPQPNIRYATGGEMWTTVTAGDQFWNDQDPEKPYPYIGTGANGFGGTAVSQTAADRSGYGKVMLGFDGKTSNGGCASYHTFIQVTVGGETGPISNLTPSFFITWWLLPTTPLNTYKHFYVTTTGAHTLDVFITSGGRMALGIDGTILVTGTHAFPSVPTMCKLYTTWRPLSGTTTSYFVFNGDSLVTHNALANESSVSLTIGYGELQIGGDNTHSAINHLDDIIIKDSSSANAADNTFADSTAIVLFLPVASDSANDHWTGALGGTSNLYLAGGNTPPKGTTAESNTTQMINVQNSANDNYYGVTQSLIAYGLPSNYRVRAIRGVVRHGAHAASNSDIGAFRMYTNPTQGYETRFRFDTTTTTAHGIESNANVATCSFTTPKFQTTMTNWIADPVMDITRGTTILLGKRTATTNQDEVDQLGIEVVVEKSSTPVLPPKVIHDR